MSVLVQGINNTGHFDAAGVSDAAALNKKGQSRNAAIYLEVEYAATDRLTLSVGVPYVFARYTGGDLPPEVPMQAVDKCHCWNSGLQDIAVTARFNLFNGPLGMTTFAIFGAPIHDYESRGEAVLGTALKELRLGVAAGYRLPVLSSRLSVESRYSYAIVEKVLDLPHNRSNTVVGAGVAITETLGVKASLAWQRTHGGLRIGVGEPPLTLPWGEITDVAQLIEHDRLLRDNSFHGVVSFAYSLRSVDLFGSYIEYIGGTATHDGRAFTGGVSWPFARK